MWSLIMIFMVFSTIMGIGHFDVTVPVIVVCSTSCVPGLLIFIQDVALIWEWGVCEGSTVAIFSANLFAAFQSHCTQLDEEFFIMLTVWLPDALACLFFVPMVLL